MMGWEKHHPEYANDELAHEIDVLECGGEEKWQEVQRRRQGAAKEVAKATDTGKADASRHVLNLYYKSKVDGTESTFLGQVDDILNVETKDGISVDGESLAIASEEGFVERMLQIAVQMSFGI